MASRIGEIGPGAEQALEQRRHEPALDVALVGGPDEAEAGQDAQIGWTVRDREPVERVDEQVGLADADRDRQHDPRARRVRRSLLRRERDR